MNRKQTRHAVYQITYHFVWCPKYRRQVLEGDVAIRLIEILQNTVTEIDGEIIELVVRPDHVHLFASFPPTIAPYQIMHKLKGVASHHLRSEFPFLRSKLPCLWTHSYYVGTAGNVSEETIRKYIEEQKGR